MEERLPLGYGLGKEIATEGSDVYTAYLEKKRVVVKRYDSPKDPCEFWKALSASCPGDYLQNQLCRDTAHWALQKQGHPNWMPLLETAVVPKASGLGWDVYEYLPQLVELEEHLDFCLPTQETYVKIARDVLAGLLALQEKGATHGRVAPEHVFFDGQNYVLGDFSGGDLDDVVGWGQTVTWLLQQKRMPSALGWLQKLATLAAQSDDRCSDLQSLQSFLE